MAEPTVITEDRVETLTRRIAELEKKLFAIGHAASCISGDSLEVIPILKGALAKESAAALERDARIAELEAALGALVIVCPEEGDLRIMMISLSGQAMTNANLIYVTAYGQRLADARKALEAK